MLPMPLRLTAQSSPMLITEEKLKFSYELIKIIMFPLQIYGSPNFYTQVSCGPADSKLSVLL